MFGLHKASCEKLEESEQIIVYVILSGYEFVKYFNEDARGHWSVLQSRVLQGIKKIVTPNRT